MVRGCSTEVSVLSKIIFSVTLSENVRKSEHSLTWETLCNIKICIRFIMRFKMSKYLVWMCGWTGSKYTWLLYFRFRFNLKTINPLETADLVKILHMFAASMAVLQVLLLFLRSSSYLLKQNSSGKKTFSVFFKSLNSSGLVSISILLKTANMPTKSFN